MRINIPKTKEVKGLKLVREILNILTPLIVNNSYMFASTHPKDGQPR